MVDKKIVRCQVCGNFSEDCSERYLPVYSPLFSGHVKVCADCFDSVLKNHNDIINKKIAKKLGVVYDEI